MTRDKQAQYEALITFGQIADANGPAKQLVLDDLVSAFWRGDLADVKLGLFGRLVAGLGNVDDLGLPTNRPRDWTPTDPQALLDTLLELERVTKTEMIPRTGPRHLGWTKDRDGDLVAVLPDGKQPPTPEQIARYPLDRYPAVTRSGYLEQLAIPLSRARTWCRKRTYRLPATVEQADDTPGNQLKLLRSAASYMIEQGIGPAQLGRKGGVPYIRFTERLFACFEPYQTRKGRGRTLYGFSFHRARQIISGSKLKGCFTLAEVYEQELAKAKASVRK